jgi:hypothetical protein
MFDEGDELLIGPANLGKQTKSTDFIEIRKIKN